MALPANVSLCLVTGRFLHARVDGSDDGRETDGVPAEGLTIQITASRNLVYDRSSDPPTTIALDPIVVRTNTLGQLITADGQPGVYVVATDDPDIDSFYWIATITGSGWPSHVVPFNAPSNGTVDLTTDAPLVVVGTTGITKGETGDAGPANVLSVKGTFSVPSTEPANVLIEGDSPNQEVTFYIPRGADGAGTGAPTGGWTKLDLSAPVQASLEKADTSVQPADISAFGNVKTVNGTAPDASGNVAVAGGGGGGSTDAEVAEYIAGPANQSNNAVEYIVDSKLGSLTPVTTPAQVLNIGALPGQNHFALQVAPVGETVVQVKTQADLASGYDLDPNFHRILENDGTSRVQFWARMDGATTSGSSYSRTELRELQQDGVTNVGFDVSTGTHWMRGKSRITHLSAVKPEVVIAQLHNGDADRIAIRTQVISGVTKLLVRVNGSAVTPRLYETYITGTEFEWMIKVVNGIGYVYFNDMLNPFITTVAMTPTTGVNTWYFKAGAYAQSNVAGGETATDYDAVQLRDLQHWHTGWADPMPVGTKRFVVLPGSAPTPVTPPLAFYSGSNPFDEALISQVHSGDLFMYDQSGSHPGWLYQWSDPQGDGNYTWEYVADLTLGKGLVNAVKTVNGTAPDASGNVAVAAGTTVTRKAAYSFGGTEAMDGDWGGATVMTQRTRFQLSTKPIRYRVRISNKLGKSDQTSTSPITINGAWVGPRTRGTWDYSGSTAIPMLMSAGSPSLVGETDWLSVWGTVQDLSKPSLLDIQFSFAANTPLSYGNGSHSILINAAKGGQLLAGTVNQGGDVSSTAWYDYFFSLLQVSIEYEYTDAAVRQGLCIGHSFVDGVSYISADPWDGQNSAWTQQLAKMSNQAITVNAYSNAMTSDFSANSTKWNRFTDCTFDWILIDVVGNDVQSGVSSSTTLINLLAMVNKCRALWPNAEIYIANLIGNKPQDTTAAHETARVAFNASLNNLVPQVIDGIVDFERTLGLATDLTTVDPRMLDANTTVGNRHLSNYGNAMLANAVNIQ